MSYFRPLASCTGCGCDDFHACPGGCWWLRVDRGAGLGVCSECEDQVETWDRGERIAHAEPVSELEDPALQRRPRPEQPATGKACAGDHDWPFEEVSDSDTCRRCGISFTRYVFTECP